MNTRSRTCYHPIELYIESHVCGFAPMIWETHLLVTVELANIILAPSVYVTLYPIFGRATPCLRVDLIYT